MLTPVTTGVRAKTGRYLKSLFITLLEMRWRYVILFFFVSFFLFYLMFAIAYYLLAWLHGDFDNLSESTSSSVCFNVYSRRR